VIERQHEGNGAAEGMADEYGPPNAYGVHPVQHCLGVIFRRLERGAGGFAVAGQVWGNDAGIGQAANLGRPG
jgi:hypothetical protein